MSIHRGLQEVGHWTWRDPCLALHWGTNPKHSDSSPESGWTGAGDEMRTFLSTQYASQGARLLTPPIHDIY